VNRALIFAPEAEPEIAEARDWYDHRSPGLGAEFVAAVDATVTVIRRNPFQYQAAWGQFRRAVLRRFPYSLIYRVSDRQISVVSCFHGRRKPKIWRERT
jgi:plasmid stabilization system protein ParE